VSSLICRNNVGSSTIIDLKIFITRSNTYPTVVYFVCHIRIMRDTATTVSGGTSHCPELLHPQQTRVPMCVTAAECAPPQFTAITGSKSGGTWHRQSSPAPQQITLPSSTCAAMCRKPQLTATTFIPRKSKGTSHCPKLLLPHTTMFPSCVNTAT
jgi:hypothetical protein